MAVIHVLPPQLADMIAAGEVVERPGSALKELMENALDAGAKHITAELMAGGAVFLRVTDDGCGMTPEDAGTCFVRHATSKLADAEGLAAIATMGFRGEALAAIAAVSRVELTTRRPGDAEGTLVTVEGGDLMRLEPTGCAPGSCFTVRDLFYNTPARLKFLKSDRSEGSWCVQLAQRVALGRPEVSVRCVRDGREVFHTPGDGRPASAVYALLGREAAAGFLPASETHEGVRVHGFVSSPAAGRGSRAMQYFFVNGRSIRSLTMQAALEQAYKNTLLTGKFPACVLYVELDPGAVDVNVHPTKNEVKFSREKRIFDAVYFAARSALGGEVRAGASQAVAAPPVPSLHGTSPAHPSVQVFSPAPTRHTAETPAPVPRPVGESAPRPAAVPEIKRPAPAPAPVRTPAPADAKMPAAGGPGHGMAASPAPPAPPAPPAEEKTPAPPAQIPLFPAVDAPPPARLVGEVMRTYIVAEYDGALLLIDKHAAHERMNFDRLKAAGRRIMSQSLLTPVVWQPPDEDREAVAGGLDLLEEAGFSLEFFGDGDIVVRGVPDTLDPSQTRAALEEICEALRRGSRELIRDEILHTIACKSAIKAGWDTDPRELQVLVDKVAAGEIRYCPHGRPVAVQLTRKELDKLFSRIV